MTEKTPRKAGFRMLPEWSRQEAVWLSWPHNPKTWPGRMENLLREYAAFAAAITRYEPLRINTGNAADSDILNRLQSAGALMENVQLFHIPTNDVWCRDHGPIFLKNPETNETAVLDFTFNAWGGKFSPFDRDNAVPRAIARILGLPCFSTPFICEGGALEVNSLGDLITTESVILNPNRNPGLEKKTAEEILKNLLGVNRILWLPSGLVNDDTDGHVDTLVRFFRDDAVLVSVDPDEDGGNAQATRRNLEVLRRSVNSNGAPLRIVELPCPCKLVSEGWRVDSLPGSYANYLLLNGAVLIPIYGDSESDERAVSIISSCFPEREAVPLHAREIIFEGGALHCLSQQQPE